MTSVIIRYKECKRNHAISVGLHAVDGCREFMTPAAGAGGGGEQGGGNQSAFLCAACGCHRNFHRKEIMKDGVVVHYGSSSTIVGPRLAAAPWPSSVVPMYVVVHQPAAVVQPPPADVLSSYDHHQHHPHHLHHQHHPHHLHHHGLLQHGSSGADWDNGEFEQKPNISIKTTNIKNEPF